MRASEREKVAFEGQSKADEKSEVQRIDSCVQSMTIPNARDDCGRVCVRPKGRSKVDSAAQFDSETRNMNAVMAVNVFQRFSSHYFLSLTKISANCEKRREIIIKIKH